MSACNGSAGQQDSQKDDKGEKSQPFTSSSLAAAEKALANGISIQDPEGDFYQFSAGAIEEDGRPDNEHPYPIPYTDLRSVFVGADENYLYVKYQYWGNFPTTSEDYQGDLIWDIGGKIEEFTFSGPDGKSTTGILNSSVSMAATQGGQRTKTNHPTVGQITMLNAIAQDIYQTSNGAGLVGGGPGQDFILSAFPLRLFGIKLGDQVTFFCSTETGSAKYHHECVDFLLGENGSKSHSVITYLLGSQTYSAVFVSEDLKDKP